MPRAIGVLNTDLWSGAGDRARDLDAIAEIARQRGYDLAKVVTITPHTYMPITHIAHTVATHGCDAVIAPVLAHLGRQAHALAHAATLETSTGTVQRATAIGGKR